MWNSFPPIASLQPNTARVGPTHNVISCFRIFLHFLHPTKMEQKLACVTRKRRNKRTNGQGRDGTDRREKLCDSKFVNLGRRCCSTVVLGRRKRPLSRSIRDETNNILLLASPTFASTVHSSTEAIDPSFISSQQLSQRVRRKNLLPLPKRSWKRRRRNTSSGRGTFLSQRERERGWRA